MRGVLVLDFDGTVTTRDIGDALCDRFAPPSWREIDAAWVRGELSLPEAQRRMWSLARATREEALTAAREIGRLRDGLDALVDGARDRGVELWLASGGFDVYIEALLGERLAGFTRRYWNRLVFDGDRMRVEFQQGDLACARCAVCKGRVCDLATAIAPRVVFAGDGYSDRCAIGRASPLCAVRGSFLAREAEERGVDFLPFDRLDELLALF